MSATSPALSTPHLVLSDVLDPSARSRLATTISARFAESGAEAASRFLDGVSVHRAMDLDVDLGDAVGPLEDVLTEVTAAARREFDLLHFRLAAIPHQVTVHTVAGDVHSHVVGDTVPAGRRIEFVYTIVPDPTGFEGGSVRLFHTLERDGVSCAGDEFTEVPLSDNSLLMFPSGHHHEVTRLRRVEGASDGTPHPVYFAIRGWLAGDPLHPPTRPLRPEAANAVQADYLPRLSEAGFEVRPTPHWVQQLLEGLLDLRGPRRTPEGADTAYHRGQDPDLVPIDDLADDLLRALMPLHEEWCGTELVPSAAFGMRCYREGASLIMHVDRAATHVVSSILQIAQDVDEPWPLVLEHDGREHSVILNPGQMLLYEGASTPHGRPGPLRGRSFVNLFLHYRPRDWPWNSDVLAQRAFENGVVDVDGRLL
ncbi:MAG: hypothetical protein RIE08_02010 [Acidimicrobiales bacterium]